MSGRDHERAEVVNTSDEERSADHPDHRRRPTPDHRDRRAEHRREAGDRREVMAKEHAGAYLYSRLLAHFDRYLLQ